MNLAWFPRLCHDSTYGQEVRVYMAVGENLLMQELKAALPE
jgi:hypothetical protein